MLRQGDFNLVQPGQFSDLERPWFKMKIKTGLTKDVARGGGPGFKAPFLEKKEVTGPNLLLTILKLK